MKQKKSLYPPKTRKYPQIPKKLETFKTHSPDTAFLDKSGIRKRFISGDKRHILADEIQKSNLIVTDNNDIHTVLVNSHMSAQQREIPTIGNLTREPTVKLNMKISTLLKMRKVLMFPMNLIMSFQKKVSLEANFLMVMRRHILKIIIQTQFTIVFMGPWKKMSQITMYKMFILQNK